MLTTMADQAAQAPRQALSNAPYRAIKRAVIFIKETYLDQVKAAGDERQLSEIAAKKAGLELVLESHRQHAQCVVQVTKALSANNIVVHAVHSNIDTLGSHMNEVDLVVTIGGDGTFLRASHEIAADIAVVGVNSAPSTSFGHFCISDGDGFLAVLSNIINGSFQPSRLLRLGLAVDDVTIAVPVLNDVLIAHRHPAGTSRYRMTVGNSDYHHKCSGLLIASPAGSTGFIRSEGGIVLPICDRQFTFVERAPFLKIGEIAEMNKGVVDGADKIVIVSEMQEGMLFIDGEHIEQPFPRGAVLTVTASDSDLLAYIDPNCHAAYMV
ncbi:MAG: NAD(+)/NADH kinase [Candidatus Obscuribacterales bacterium]|nr:NAD(+)/NADH kinase [Candidatus Obscuribacterales bacterium]